MHALQRYLFPGRIRAAILRRWRKLGADVNEFLFPYADNCALMPIPVRSEDACPRQNTDWRGRS